MATINFVNDAVIQEDDPNLTLLEVSEKHHIPHMHVCGGMARCSTCRVMVVEHPENLTPATLPEKRLADKLGFESGIRLACQARATGPVTVRRLTLDDEDASLDCAVHQAGREARLAILFSDIRGFTTFSENALPYDVVHVLNRYFYQMGEAILAHGGYLDKYIGDGIMALFGVACNDAEVNCRNAVHAGLRMLDELENFNAYLKRNFGCEFKIGIGIHFGEAVIGELGHPRRRQVTAIGDAVNMASRIESATKDCGVPMLISDSVVAQLEGRVQLGKSYSTMLKGKSGVYALYETLGLREESIGATREATLRRRLNHALRPVVTMQRAAQFLRCAFHDSGSYNPEDGSGGANGTLHLPQVLSLPEHRGVAACVELLKPVKEQFPEISWADLFVYAGAFAVKILGGPDIAIALGRVDGGKLPTPGRLTLDTMNLAQLKSHFTKLGFNTRELVALSGSHTVGVANGKPMTEDWFRFNNSFFKALTSGGQAAAMMIPSDRAMTDDPDCMEWIRQYAADEKLFFDDFADAYKKMSLLGAHFES